MLPSCGAGDGGGNGGTGGNGGGGAGDAGDAGGGGGSQMHTILCTVPVGRVALQSYAMSGPTGR